MRISGRDRRISIRVEVDIWAWPSGRLSNTEDITKDILNYRFQKSIKSPSGTCQIAILPQRADTSIMDVISPMDVVRIYEFGTLKFIGQILRVSYSGSIGQDGKPNRQSTITCQQMGALLTTASVGFGLGTALGVLGDGLSIAARELRETIANLTTDNTGFSELVRVTLNAFKDYLSKIDATNFLDYMGYYLDFTSGLVADDVPKSPRIFDLFTGNEQSLTLWQVLEQLVERPFNELWIDNGPRNVSIGGNSVRLPESACVVFRPVPFNGTTTGVQSENAFDLLPAKHIDANHLLSFDFARSIDEVYTMYSVKNAAWSLQDIARLLLGRSVVDVDRVGKYLFKPLITELFFTRALNTRGDNQEISRGDMGDISRDYANTLYNWFRNNDEYLSGVISHMVPEHNVDDPKIGEKVTVYGIEGSFYVEGIAHLWNYQGPLRCDLTVTRGYNGNERIQMRDRIFRRTVTR